MKIEVYRKDEFGDYLHPNKTTLIGNKTVVVDTIGKMGNKDGEKFVKYITTALSKDNSINLIDETAEYFIMFSGNWKFVEHIMICQHEDMVKKVTEILENE